MQVARIFQGENESNADVIRPWNQADFEGWLSVLTWKVREIKMTACFVLRVLITVKSFLFAHEYIYLFLMILSCCVGYGRPGGYMAAEIPLYCWAFSLYT